MTCSVETVNETSWRRAAVWLVVVTFAVRMAFVLGLGTYLYDRLDDVSRFNETTYIAESVAEGHGFSSPFGGAYTGPSAWIPPVYPYLCALIFKAFGGLDDRAWLVIFTLQSLFSALTIVPMLGIARCTVGYRAGIWAGAAWALFPWFSKWAVTWVYETSLSALLVSLLLWYALNLETEKSGYKAWFFFGALWGVALLVNPALATIFLVTLGWGAYSLPRSRENWLLRPVLAFVCCLLVISPWMIRNRIVLGHWVFVRSNFGAEFALGNYHGSLGRGEANGRHPSTSATELQHYRDVGELVYVQGKNEQARQFIREYPEEFIFLTAKRVLYFWDGSGKSFRPPLAWYWLPWSFAPLSFLFVFSLGFACWNRIHAWPMFLIVVLLYPAPYYLVFSVLRYRHVLEPVLLLLLAYAVESFLKRQPPQQNPHGVD